MNNSYKEFISFKSIFYFCSLPLRLDSYKGCVHGCLYCFSQQLNNRKASFFTDPKPANPRELQQIFTLLQKQTEPGPVRSCLKHRLPIHFGSVSDPFQPLEKKLRISYQFLEILQKNNYPTIISTKSSLVADEEYIKIYKKMPIGIQFSFSTFDDKLAKKLEPNAPLPKDRLEAIKRLTDEGIWVAVRLQPFLFPLYKPDDINIKMLKSIGVSHVILEHLRIPTNSSIYARDKLFNILHMNMLEKFRDLGIRVNRINYELSSKIKLENIKKIKEKVHSEKMTFGSGDNDFHHFSDSHCCCGLPGDKEFKNLYKGNIAYAIKNTKIGDHICFNNIHDQWQPRGSLTEFINSDCRINNNSASGLLIDQINNPNKSNSPSAFFGVEYDQESNDYVINL